MNGVIQSRAALVAIAALAFAAGVFLPGSVMADPELAMLLRFMAVMKAAMALAALALMVWRLGSPMKPGLAVAGAASVTLMAAASGLIWSLAHVALGAVLFHAGLFAALYVAWRDEGSVRLRAGPMRLSTLRLAALTRENARGRI